MHRMKKYQIENSIGNGNFSTVYNAREISTQKPCAIKIMKTHTSIAFRQAQLLKKFKHPNVIALIDFQQADHESWLVLEKAGINTLQLYEKHKHGLREEQVKCILFQAALGLAYVHSFGVIHRDVKPQNLLIDKKSASVKIIDFGLAINEQNVNTDYIATRWYRAPQNLLGTKQYYCAIDVFSLGCVIVELYLGSPLFPGANNLDQILKIFNILGYPSPEQWKDGYQKMNDLGMKPILEKDKKIDLRQILHPCDKKLIDLIVRMLALNPRDRITCEQIVKHQYFQDIRPILPPVVYSRYEQDYLAKKQFTFKASNKRQPRLNLNQKYPISLAANTQNMKFVNSNGGAIKNKPILHKSSQNQALNGHENFRLKKSASIDSAKSCDSHLLGPRQQKKEPISRQEFQSKVSIVKTNRINSESYQSLTHSKNDWGFVKEVKKSQSLTQTFSNNNVEFSKKLSFNTTTTKKEPLVSPISNNELQNIQNSKTSTGDSTRMMGTLPVIPNIPMTKTQNYYQVRKHISSQEDPFRGNHSPPVLKPELQSTQHPNYPINSYQHLNNFSLHPNYQKPLAFLQQSNPPQGYYQSNLDPQRVSLQQQKVSNPIRRNRVLPINNPTRNQSDNSYKMPLSPQHHFQGMNFSRNMQFQPNTRRQQTANQRAYFSPTIHSYHSPPPTLASRKYTVMSPNQRMCANSPESHNFFRPYNPNQHQMQNSSQNQNQGTRFNLRTENREGLMDSREGFGRLVKM